MMADNSVDAIPRQRVLELFDAIEAVLSPFVRVELRTRFQGLLRRHNRDQGAAYMYVERDSFDKLYDDVATALEAPPSRAADDHDDNDDDGTPMPTGSRPPFTSYRYPVAAYEADMKRREQEWQEQQQRQQQEQEQKQEPVTPSPAPRQPRPLLAPDKMMRNQNIWHRGRGGGGNANVSARSLEDARFQMANAARAWQSIGGGLSSYWNKLKAQSGVAGKNQNQNQNQNQNKNKNKKNDDNGTNKPSSYTPATRRAHPSTSSYAHSASTPAAARPAGRDSRIVKKKAAPALRQNLQQLSKYVRSQAAERRAAQTLTQTQTQAQTQKTPYDLDNDVIMRELRRMNRQGKRPRR